jgi:hypothetical protein
MDILDGGDICEDNCAINNVLLGWTLMQQREKSKSTVLKADDTPSLRIQYH